MVLDTAVTTPKDQWQELKSAMRFLLTAFLLYAGFFAPAYAVSDGVYYAASPATGVAIVDINGRKAFLGARFTEKFDSETLVSKNNENSLYQITLQQNKGITLPYQPISLALVFGNKSLLFGGGGNSTSRWWDSDLVTDRDFIDRTKAFFNITPEDRHHPGHQFTAAFRVNPQGYPLGDPVTVTLELTNCGREPFFIQQPSVPIRPFTNPFSFIAYGTQYDPKGEAVTVRPFAPELAIDFQSTKVSIEPQETQSIPVNLSDYLVFKKAGDYNVRGSYAFQVLSGDRVWKTLWDDFATAEFQVTIK